MANRLEIPTPGLVHHHPMHPTMEGRQPPPAGADAAPADSFIRRPLLGGAVLCTLTTLAFAGAFLLPGKSSGGSCGKGGLVDRVDVDGDSRKDDVFWGFDGSELILRVCTASGRRSEVAGSGMGEEYFAIDVEADGRAELLVGGNSVSMGVTDVMAFRDGRVRALQLPTGDRLSVDQGWEWGEGGEVVRDAAWGCSDLDGDGRRELVQVNVTWPERRARVETIAYKRASGAGVLAVPIARPEQVDLPQEIGVAGRFVGRCTPLIHTRP